MKVARSAQPAVVDMLEEQDECDAEAAKVAEEIAIASEQTDERDHQLDVERARYQLNEAARRAHMSPEMWLRAALDTMLIDPTDAYREYSIRAGDAALPLRDIVDADSPEGFVPGDLQAMLDLQS